MGKDITKFVIVPVDGSTNALKPIDYIKSMYHTNHNLKIALLHVLPALPPIMVAESKRNRQTAKQLKLMQEKLNVLGNDILEKAQKYLLRMGFQADRIEKIIEHKGVGIARDIAAYVEKRNADTLVIPSSGKGWLEGFFMGEVTNKLVEINQICPVWVVKGDVKHINVVIAVDGSQNSMRSVDHAGFMLTGTSSKITLVHVATSIQRFFPKEAIEGFEDFEDTWSKESGKAIEPSMNKAIDMLVQSGIDAAQIDVKYVDGGRRLAKTLLQEAKKLHAGTIVMGRRGINDVKDYSLGSITRKVLSQAEDMAIWIAS